MAFTLSSCYIKIITQRIGIENTFYALIYTLVRHKEKINRERCFP